MYIVCLLSGSVLVSPSGQTLWKTGPSPMGSKKGTPNMYSYFMVPLKLLDGPITATDSPSQATTVNIFGSGKLDEKHTFKV